MTEHDPCSPFSGREMGEPLPRASPLTIWSWRPLPPAGCDLIALVGELDTLGARRAAPTLGAWIETTTAPHAHVDLSRVSFFDGRGVGLLLELRRRADRQDRALEFVRASQPVRWLLEICQLSELLDDGPQCQARLPVAPPANGVADDLTPLRSSSARTPVRLLPAG